jgi:hypothetical protein
VPPFTHLSILKRKNYLDIKDYSIMHSKFTSQTLRNYIVSSNTWILELYCNRAQLLCLKVKLTRAKYTRLKENRRTFRHKGMACASCPEVALQGAT